jgi:hypothetical protein
VLLIVGFNGIWLIYGDLFLVIEYNATVLQ